MCLRTLSPDTTLQEACDNTGFELVAGGCPGSPTGASALEGREIALIHRYHPPGEFACASSALPTSNAVAETVSSCVSLIRLGRSLAR